MRRLRLSFIPLIVAAAALVLSAPAAWAQHEEHGTTAGHSCVCCGNSATAATNHAAEGGCCSHMKASETATGSDVATDQAPIDHSAHTQSAPAPDTATAEPAFSPAGMACGAGATADNTATQDSPAAKDAPAKMKEGGCCAGKK